jgi:predicted nuclease with TOPRIM domain
LGSILGAIDVSGVALKGVQALIEKVETLKEKVEGLKIENSNYQNKLQKQELLLQQLMTRLEALENQ